MELQLKRIFAGRDYTIGRLSVDGMRFCDTLEDPVRDLTKERKIPGNTAIPAGVYDVVVNVSPKFRRLLPRLLNVPHFEGILIHRGNTAKDTAGCILVGLNKYKGMLVDSTAWEQRLVELLRDAQESGDQITIEVIDPC